MRRISLWLASTVSVLVLLLGYHTSTGGSGGEAAASGAVAPSIAGTSLTPGSSGSSDSSGSSGGAGSAGSASGTTYTGDSVSTRWGPVQVAITVTDGKITDVAVPVYPSENPRDQEINSYALPQLVQETIAAQSADIDMVSGATFTSDGYRQSLQSALDQAGL
ncbi:FMN-binding protein [Nocardioides sp.]|uniref:FMN-binding protein n=1 Tax=Nocardioides sp. TaxID=35761 RepID=UPI003519639A